MITTNKETTTVKFGQNGIASIGTNVTGLTLTLKQLKVEKQIGDKIESEDDVQPLPKIELNFTDRKSIDIMIDALMVLRNNHDKLFQLACCA